MARTKHNGVISSGAGAAKMTTKPTVDRNIYPYGRIPQSNLPKSGPMQTHLIRKRPLVTSPSRSPSPAPSDASVSSDREVDASAASKFASDHEVDTSAASKSKVSAFHKARGASFDELYVDSDSATDTTHISAVASSKKVPQKKSAPAMRSTGKPKFTVNAVPAKPSPQRLKAQNDKKTSSANDVPADTEPTCKKRAADADSSVSSTPVKRLKINPPRAPAKRPAESSDTEHTSQPTKRLKINPPRAPAPAPAPAPTQDADAAHSDKPKPKTKGGPVITKNGKVKKTPEYAVEHAFEGTPSNHGFSLECPKFGTLKKPWSCANLGCTTGMTWVPRDTKDPTSGKGPMGRKVISQFFGRNKGPTKLIPNDVWHFFCRKDYQRARYAAEHGTADELARQVIDNLRHQLVRLRLWRPDALFQIQLDKGATDRLNSYFALLRQHNNNEAAALAALPAPKDPKKVKPEEAFPPALAEAFNQRFKTPGKTATATYDDIEAVIAWSETQIDNGTSTVFVPVEFLINPIQPNETVNDVDRNFSDWEIIRAARLAQAALEAQEREAALATASQSANTCPGPDDVVQSIEDPEATEVDSEAAPTPTPAPRKRSTVIPPSRPRDPKNDPMAIMRFLNDEAEQMGFDARIDRSRS